MRRTVTTLAVLLLVAGCGSASSTNPAARPSGSATSSPSSYGVDTVDWPNDLAGARAVFEALPATVAGRKKAADIGADGGWADYGSDEDLTLMVQPGSADPSLGGDLPDALAIVASMSTCDPATLAGTAPIEGLKTATEDNDVWFSCRVAADSDMPNRGGVVLGWTSGTLSWLANAPDAESMAQLVKPLVTAAAARPGDGPGTRPASTGEKAPYDLERTVWPADQAKAEALLAAVPTLEGQSVEVGVGGSGGPETADYPAGDRVLLNAPEGGLDANAMLAASFGLVYACAPGSYRGTAPGIEGGKPARPTAGSKVRWFTCQVDGAEGDEDFRGYAIGWTGGGFAWLVIGTTKARAATLTESLVAAAQQ